ncbi:hypothetical protein ABZZ74_47560 [Streptomyces sp. NPDC006476]|uniref:hypothetical protein n=1 Tax=Streptomyces sp. NPDC006476 TaxID=3157175 RepID=UPI0033A6DF14
MEVAELVLKYVQAVVWPLVTVVLAWTLRNHIPLRRMTRLETPAGSIEFATDAREIRSEAEELAADTEPESPTGGGTAEDQTSQFGVFQEAWNMADVSPIGALVTAWLLLESLSKRELAKRGALPEPRGAARLLLPNQIIEALDHLGLSPRGVSVFHDLRQLRNRAMHGDVTVTPVAARDYVESARFVALQVHSLPMP